MTPKTRDIYPLSPHHFQKYKVFLPVIHLPDDGRHALRAVEVALGAGADGVFLINQGTSTSNIVSKLIPSIRLTFGEHTWIGINSLGSAVEDVVAMSLSGSSLRRLDGIWADDAGVDSLQEDTFQSARTSFLNARQKTKWRGLYFGGTAFKTQAAIPENKLELVARNASSFVDVVTTSGRGTGVAADPARIRVMREAIPGSAMGIASGITPENAMLFLPYIDFFLVASGIEQSFGVLDPARTRALADIIHAYDDSAILDSSRPDHGPLATDRSNLSMKTLIARLANSDPAERSRICFELTIGFYKEIGKFDELLELFMQETKARRGHGRECEYSPVFWIDSQGIAFQFNRNAFPSDSPIVAYADDDGSPIEHFHMSDCLRYLRTEAVITEKPGHIEGRPGSWGDRKPIKRHFFKILPGSQAPTLMKLTGGEFNMEFSWLSDAGLQIIHEDDFICK
jgi:hypothetical protein